MTASTLPKKKGIDGTADMPPPWQPASVIPADLYAIHALCKGDANADQQRRVVDFIRRATAVEEMEFRPDGERASNFAAGKRFVGLQFFTLARAVMPERTTTAAPTRKPGP